MFVNEPVKSNILQQLKQNPKANYKELADKTGFSTATIKRMITEARKQSDTTHLQSHNATISNY